MLSIATARWEDTGEKPSLLEAAVAAEEVGARDGCRDDRDPGSSEKEFFWEDVNID